MTTMAVQKPISKDLYLIQSDVTGAFKIGITKNVKKRIKQLQTGSPHKLKLILLLKGQSHRERSLHRALRSVMTRDTGEWFSYEAFAYLPDDIYEQLDLDLVDTWWRKE